MNQTVILKSFFLKLFKISLVVIPSLFLLTVIVYTFLFEPRTISGDSMEKGKYANNSRHIVCKICSDIKRGDVVSYRSRNNNDIELIGRVVGLPSDNVVIDKTKVTINGKQLTENYADWSEWNYADKINIKLADNEFFTLLDKRTTPSEIDSFLNNRKFYKAEYVGKIL